MEKQRKLFRFSIRWKIFLIMLAVSVLPLIIFTGYTATTQYKDTYERMVINNNNSISRGEERLTLFIDDMKNTFNNIELDKQFKKVITNREIEYNTSDNFSVIRKTILAQLDRKTNFSVIDVYLVNNNIKVKVSRSGSFLTEQENSVSVFERPMGTQTNMFLKKMDGKLYAIHYINTFPDKILIAKIAVELKEKILGEIIEQLKIYETESVYILNDEFETILSIGNSKDLILNKSIKEMQSENFNGGSIELDKYYILFGKSSGGKITIVKMVPKSEILNAVMPTVYAGIWIGVICVITAIFFSALLSYYVSKPIVALTRKVKNISIETLEIPNDVYSTDEVGVLEDHISLFVKEIKELILKEYETKLEAKSAQIRALQAQINPHFLHNTLQLMGSISLSKDANNVYTIASALSDMMRYSMNFKEVFVTLEDELRNVNNYLLIQQTRYYDKFKIDLEIADEVRDCLIPKMILQPLVENSFRHGFEYSTEEWVLSIRSYLENERVIIIIKDNGVGILPKTLKSINEILSIKEPQINSESHIGLVNVNSRLKLHFSEEDGVTVTSMKGKGTEIRVTFGAKRQEVENNGI